MLHEQVRLLEEEKNALLDYIEESATATENSRRDNDNDGQEDYRMTMNDAKIEEMSNLIKTLEADKANLYQMTEDLKYQEGMSRQKISELQTQLATQLHSGRTLSS